MAIETEERIEAATAASERPATTLAELAAVLPVMAKGGGPAGLSAESFAAALACVPLLALLTKRTINAIYGAPVAEVVPELARILRQLASPDAIQRVMADAVSPLQAFADILRGD